VLRRPWRTVQPHSLRFPRSLIQFIALLSATGGHVGLGQHWLGRRLLDGPSALAAGSVIIVLMAKPGERSCDDVLDSAEEGRVLSG